jgi:hypothetical protein
MLLQVVASGDMLQRRSVDSPSEFLLTVVADVFKADFSVCGEVNVKKNWAFFAFGAEYRVAPPRLVYHVKPP